jgi:hypothetical protein
MRGGKDFFYLTSPAVFALPGIVPRSHPFPDLGNLTASAAMVFKNGHPFPLSHADSVKAFLIKEPIGQNLSLHKPCEAFENFLQFETQRP